MLYLDNAATEGSKPAQVRAAVLAAMKVCANPGRSGHRLSLAHAEHVLACRQLLSDVFGGYGFERAVFTRSCTEALNLAIFGVLGAGDHVVCTTLEHNSVLRPLHALAERGVISYDVAPLTDGKLLPETVASLVKENTRLVCVTAASNVTGVSCDLKAVRSLLPEKVLLLTDGAQGAGHIPISMKGAGIDLLALAGHKGLHAIQIGALLFSERVEPHPLIFGGTGSESLSLGMPSFYPDRLESGTLSYPAVCSLFEGLTILKSARRSGLYQVTAALREAVVEMPAYEIFSPPNACGIFSFRHKGIPSEEVASLLSDRFDIAVRGGLHCAPLAHKALGTLPDGLVRASFSTAQGMREAAMLVNALKKI